jgi:hypothetical protein
VSEQRVLADGQPQVLASTPDLPNLAAFERRRQVIRSSQMTPDCPRMKDCYFSELAPDDMIRQAGSDALHLWQFRHWCLLSISR